MQTKRAEFTPPPKGSGFSSDRLIRNELLTGNYLKVTTYK